MKKTLLVILQFSLFLGISAYIYLGSLTRMLADDFCSAYLVNRLGLLRAIWNTYNNWNGRYTAYAADWFFLNLTLGPYRVNAIVPIMLFLWFAALSALLYFYFKGKGVQNILHVSLLGSGFIFTWLLLSPFVEQSLFWWNAARSYSLPVLLLTVSALLLYLLRQFERTPSFVLYGASFFLFFMIGGTGETYVVGQAGLLSFLILFLFLHSRFQNKKDFYTLAAGLAGTLLSIVVMIFAPGNDVRQSLLPPPPDVHTLISVSIQSYGMFFQDMFNTTVKTAGFAGALFLFAWIGAQDKTNFSVKWQTIAIVFFAGIAISFACFLPGVYGFSEPPPARTIPIPLFYFLAPTFLAAYLSGSLLRQQAHLIRFGETGLALLIVILMGYASIVNSMNFFSRRQEYIDFARRWDEVDVMILAAKAEGKESVQIPAMINWAYLAAPTDNPNFWATRCYRNYYGIKVLGPSMEEIMEIYREAGFP